MALSLQRRRKKNRKRNLPPLEHFINFETASEARYVRICNDNDFHKPHTFGGEIFEKTNNNNNLTIDNGLATRLGEN